MARQDMNDGPPPYDTVVVHALPPLSSYDEAVYGEKPPTHPYYMPQYTPSVVGAPVAQPAPRSSRRKCCQRNSQWYGAVGATLVVLALLALAIWIGLRYGTTYTTIFYHDVDVDYEPDEPLDIPDICSNNSIPCDGIKDCDHGSDETDCVRFVADNSLQIKTSQDGRFLPVCFADWDQEYSQRTCSQLGFRTPHAWAALQSAPSIAVKVEGQSSAEPIQGQVEVSSSCPDQKTVSLQCVECGIPKTQSRIIGGQAATSGEWPWQMSLHYLGSHVCGAALISPDFLLTAAHCFSSPSTQNWAVYGGTVSQDRLPAAFEVDKILISEKYVGSTNDHDVALIKLRSPVEFTDYLRPICLPHTGQVFQQGTKCWTTGFGVTEVNADSSARILHDVDVDLISRQDCNSPGSYGGAVTRNMICAGHLDGGKDSCQGDSGGPLVCKVGDRWHLVGLTSWGEGCGKKDKPGVYTNVRSVLSWVYSKMQETGL